MEEASRGLFIDTYEEVGNIPTRRSDHSEHISSPRKYSVRVFEAQLRSYKIPT